MTALNKKPMDEWGREAAKQRYGGQGQGETNVANKSEAKEPTVDTKPEPMGKP